ncbi:MAG: PAS domain S-box protein [Chitinispirillaceae bacterium]|nr:PAS domain S-box protein [Chitinispirillaceae bacterium]
MATAERTIPDLILLDVHLDDTSGIELCRKIRAQGTLKTTPVLLVSGSDDPEIWPEGLASGADDYIIKPFRKTELLSRIKTHFALSSLKKTCAAQKANLLNVERKAAESIRKYQELFKNSPVGKIMITLNGTTIPNQTFCDMLGYSIAELQAMNWQDFTHPDDLTVSSENMAELLNGKTDKVHFEKRLIRKDGSILWVDLVSYLHYDPNHQPVHFITTVHNISKRKKVELALKEKSRFTEQLIEATALATWISDEHGTAVGANRACFDLFGATEQEVIGKYNIFNDEIVEQQGVMPKIRHAFTTGEPITFLIDYDFSGVKHVTVEKATHTFLQVILTPIKNSSGTVTNVVSQSIDLTEIRHTQEKLRESELKYRIVAENTYDLEFWRDPQGTYLYVSPSCERITGYRSEDFMANALLLESIIVPEDRPLFKEHLLKEVADHRCGAVEFRITRADGEVRWMSHHCLPVFDGKGNYLGTRGNNRDITDQKLLEKERTDLQFQLHQAQKLEAIGQLASGIAHDFNNILGGISGYADLLKLKYRKDSETSEFVRKISASAGRAAGLTRQLLTFARKAAVDKKFFDVHTSIGTTIEMLERTINKNISINKMFSPVTPLLFSDRSLFESCLLNLGINARDAMPEGGTLTITTDYRVIGARHDTEGKFTWKPGRYIVITVTDTGTGMNEAVRQRIFEPFFTTKEPGKGTGLGLASVYGFIKQHDGYITVESTEGKGTCFTLYFPVTHPVPPQEPSAADEQIHPQPGTGTILIVDDDEDIRATLYVQLKQTGYRPVLCSNGLEAIRYFRVHFRDIAAVLLDVIMPEMDGLECLHEMKLVNPNVKIIICTGYTGNESKEAILKEDVFGFLEKPFKFAEVASYLQKALKTTSAPPMVLDGVSIPASEDD